ncbi:MAG: carbohydrate ABC transporter permease [Gammaproteobacteria bacterium]|jgi:multiple sugar transport system permease protein|nr:carbohydrate ABC transporter permease [Gammaproteobacteria bacterium]|tara:strand:- start:223 stop:1380 length:1158 start_codon:yes stop_codon:yes gene_type:complete
MTNVKALRQPLSLRLSSSIFLTFWCVVAAFPIFWITVMSVKLPIDAFNGNPLKVIFGPTTLAQGKGLSILDITIGLTILIITAKLATGWLIRMVGKFSPSGYLWAGWIIGSLTFGLLFVLVFFGLQPSLLNILNDISGILGINIIGFSTEHYSTVWFEKGFFNNFQNSLLVTTGVVTISLTFGTLAGYALSRSSSNLAFWILIIALIFRALPHSVLVTGYLPFFMNSAEILRPLLGDAAPTLYGLPWATIAVLVAINQPFTIWMLRSFFQNIPAELDEAAQVDGCSHFQAFRRVIMPVMWPGVITTGLFSFLLAYNDFLVTSLLLDVQNQTMVPAIARMFNMETTTTDQVVAVAAAVSIVAPLFFLVLFFQRQIVSGLTAGAVKG